MAYVPLPPTPPPLAPVAATNAAAADVGLFYPRMLLGVQYPLGGAASAGVWLWSPQDRESQRGLVVDATLGMYGASFDVGAGIAGSPHAGWEGLWSYGTDLVVAKTFANSAWRPPSSTYVGPEIFFYIAGLRCSVGMLWRFEGPASTSADLSLAGGCGLGLR